MLGKLAVGQHHLVLKAFINAQVDSIHPVGRPGLKLNLIHDILVDVHQGVSGLHGVGLSTDGLLEDVFFGLHADIMVAEAPPAAELAVVDERVIVATIRASVVHKNRMQLIGYLAVVGECICDAHL